MTFLRERLLGTGGHGPEIDDDSKARRAASLFAIALIVVALGGLAFVLLEYNDSDSEPEVTTTVEIGPLAETDLSSYMAARAEALADASGERLAVVSLTRYVTEPEARAAMGALAVTKLLAAPPGGTPSAVNGSMGDWVNAQVAGSREERDELQKMLPTVDDPEFRSFYQSEVARLSQVVDAVRPDGPLVFAVAVRGPADALRELAKNPVVRLVDVGPTAEAAPGASYRGLRPEETTKADDPPTRPL